MGEFIDLVRDGDSAMRAYKALPASGRGPVVVVLQEIFGVNAAMRSVADDLAANGFVALVPDMFWRIEPGIELDYGEEGLQKARAAWQAFDMEAGVADAAAAIAAGRKLAEGTGKVAVLGFCLGGQVAVKAAAREPADAVVSFYGVRLHESLDEIAGLACPTLFHFGDADGHIPAETREAIGGVASGKPAMEMFVYVDAGHGFFNAFRPSGFNAKAHEQSRVRSLDMLSKALGVETVAAS
jgi:carboxymethylenebutenolidase